MAHDNVRIYFTDCFFVLLFNIPIFQDVDAILSIGGWTGSQYFSIAMATPANRTAFVQAVLDLVSKYDLDGIDFEYVIKAWIYPD